MGAKEKALELMERDPVLYMDMLGPFHRGMTEIVAQSEEGLLLYNAPGRAYMLAADTRAEAEALCAGVESMSIATAHSREAGEFLRDRYSLPDLQPCIQAAYLVSTPLPLDPALEIRQLDQSYFSVILENYHTFTDAAYVRRRIDAGVMHGAFREGEMLGFIGMHDEGSVGMLEVLPPHRRQGAAAALMAFMTNWCLVRGWVPFSQIFAGNEASLSLHRRVGWTLSQKPMYWVMPD